MRSTPTIVIASAALVLSGCAVGLLLGRWMTSPPADMEKLATPASPATVDLAPLVAEIRRSNDLVLEAVRAVGGSGAARAADRASATPDSNALQSNAMERLIAAVERTNDLLAAGSTPASPRALSVGQWQGAGYESLDAMLARVDQANRDQATDVTNMELNRLHALWTREDVFARYGPPQEMSPSDRGIRLVYLRQKTPDEATSVAFFTADGLVTSVWSD